MLILWHCEIERVYWNKKNQIWKRFFIMKVKSFNGIFKKYIYEHSYDVLNKNILFLMIEGRIYNNTVVNT